MKITSTKHYNYLSNTFSGIFAINLPIKTVFGSVIGTVIYLTGATTQTLEIIGILLLADLLMGLLAAIKHKTLSSDFLVTILYRAAMYFILLMGVNWFILMCPYLSFLKELMHFFIAATELISILENAGLLGFKHAQKVINIINRNIEDKLNKQ